MTSLPPATSKSKSLRKLYDEVQGSLQGLTALGQDVNHPLCVPMIITKLPQAVLIQLELTKETDTWSVPSLRAALGAIVKSERGKRTTVSRRVNYHEKQKQTGSTVNLNERDITYIEKSRQTQ